MKRPVVACILLSTLIPLGACAPTPQESEVHRMSPDQAKEQVLGYFADVRDVVGADQWTERNSWGPCQVNGHSDEVQWTFSAERFAQLAGSPDSYGGTIAAAWRDRGLNPSAAASQTSANPLFLVSDPPSFAGLRADGGFTQISIDPGSALFRAKSTCVAGRLEDMDAPEG